MEKFYTITEVADLLSVSKETLRRWDKNGKLSAVREPMSNYRVYQSEQLRIFSNLDFMFEMPEKDVNEHPVRDFYAIELFAGAGGLAIGMEKAGIKCLALNEFDHWACETLRMNRPDWNVIEDDVRNISFDGLTNKVDVVTGGFPCQAFSYAGKKLGLADARGTLFYEFARIVNDTKPALCIGENVRGLITHDNGRTIDGMVSILDEIGYTTTPSGIEEYYRFLVSRISLFAPKNGVVTIINRDRKANGTVIRKHNIFCNAMEKSGWVLKSQRVWVRSYKANLYRYNYSFIQTFIHSFVRPPQVPNLYLHIPHATSFRIKMTRHPLDQF